MIGRQESRANNRYNGNDSMKSSQDQGSPNGLTALSIGLREGEIEIFEDEARTREHVVILALVFDCILISAARIYFTSSSLENNNNNNNNKDDNSNNNNIITIIIIINNNDYLIAKMNPREQRIEIWQQLEMAAATTSTAFRQVLSDF